MDERWRHRLIGTLVLVSGILALAPLVLHGRGLWLPRVVDIPKAPAIASPPVVVGLGVVPVAQRLVPAGPQVVTAPVPSQPNAVLPQHLAVAVKTQVPVDRAADDPDTVHPALPEGWTVQVASLDSDAAAQRLANKLRTHGYHVYERQLGQVHKVFVGPELQKSLAEQQKHRLQLEGVAGWMQRYTLPDAP